jgi:hypothetical protein
LTITRFVFPPTEARYWKQSIYITGPDQLLRRTGRDRRAIARGPRRDRLWRRRSVFPHPGLEDPDALMEALELFGKKVLPHIRDV